MDWKDFVKDTPHLCRRSSFGRVFAREMSIFGFLESIINKIEFPFEREYRNAMMELKDNMSTRKQCEDVDWALKQGIKFYNKKGKRLRNSIEIVCAHYLEGVIIK